MVGVCWLLKQAFGQREEARVVYQSFQEAMLVVRGLEGVTPRKVAVKR
jgi:hypothetical protein